MDITAATKLHKDAPWFINKYESREILCKNQVVALKVCAEREDKILLINWVDNNTTWLEENKELYLKSKHIAQLSLDEFLAITKGSRDDS